jgi:hypothetical protein
VEAVTLSLDVEGWQARQIEAHSACVVEHGATTDRYGRTWESVQPWLDATTLCETCGGAGRVQGMNHGPADLLFPCPDCRNGHPIVELRAPCPTCEGAITKRPSCPLGGWVSLGRYTVPLLVPVAADHQAGDYVIAAGGSWVLVRDSGTKRETARTLTLDRPPVPGRDMVAVLAKEEV